MHWSVTRSKATLQYVPSMWIGCTLDLLAFFDSFGAAGFDRRAAGVTEGLAAGRSTHGGLGAHTRLGRTWGRARRNAGSRTATLATLAGVADGALAATVDSLAATARGAARLDAAGGHGAYQEGASAAGISATGSPTATPTTGVAATAHFEGATEI